MIDWNALPVLCALCRATVRMDKTEIQIQPILHTNEDGSAKPVYHGMATVAEFRICKSH